MNPVLRYTSSPFMDPVLRYTSTPFKGYSWSTHGHILLKTLNPIMRLLPGVVFSMSGDVCFH